MTKADGTKYGKSETGTVWLDPALTSPYQFYQFFSARADADAPRLIRVFTLLSAGRNRSPGSRARPQPRACKRCKKALARRRHHPGAFRSRLRSRQQPPPRCCSASGDLSALDEATLRDVFAGVPHLRVPCAAAGGPDRSPCC
ncbi:MAG: hypothetical protein WKG07_11920 [Hymenobacter sp.]